MIDDLENNYSKAYAGKAGFAAKPALLMIDFVQAYFDPSCSLYAAPAAALSSALRLRAAARAAGLLVVVTHVEYHPLAIDGGRFFEKATPLKHFLKGSALGRWPDGLSPLDDELVVTKQYPSAFFGTSLASTLTARGVDGVILTGLTTSGCVRATCVDAMSHGFITTVVADACGDRHEKPHDANLFDMDAKYADVISEPQALDYISSRTPAPTP